MGLRGPLRWAGRGMALCSGLLPLTGAIPPGGAAAWILLTLAVPLLLAGELAEAPARAGKARAKAAALPNPCSMP